MLLWVLAKTDVCRQMMPLLLCTLHVSSMSAPAVQQNLSANLAGLAVVVAWCCLHGQLDLPDRGQLCRGQLQERCLHASLAVQTCSTDVQYTLSEQ
jgi:hypothetical protein